MPDDLYERDALAWAERQSDLLRRLSAGERVNEQIDWDNVVEEVRDVGIAELHGCQSLLTRALAHLLKLYALPTSPAAAHWEGEVNAFLNDARRHYTPSMRRRIDAAALYKGACAEAGPALKSSIDTAAVPQTCPVTLEELVSDETSVADLLSRFAAHTSA